MAKTKFIVPLGNDTNHPVGRRVNILSELALTKGEYNIFFGNFFYGFPISKSVTQFVNILS